MNNKKFKFDVVIGNPPYQDETKGDNKRYAPPIYDKFIVEAYKIGKIVELIHPGRFLFNAGSTPKKWNKEMLNDPHLKIVYYEQDSSKVFHGTDIKGGIAVSYRDDSRILGPIGVFSPYPIVNTIMKKVTKNSNFVSLSEIIYSRTAYRFTDKMHQENPEAHDKLSKGHDYDVSSNIFERLPELFSDQRPEDGQEYIRILGRINGKRVFRYIKSQYINPVDNTDKWKVVVPQANGTGELGEKISHPEVIGPGTGSTETFIEIGNCSSQIEAMNLAKYIKTKLCRLMLGILKITQNGNKPVWRLVPLQDFTQDSGIDWSKSIQDIDQQLYKKYDLNQQEIEFIETHVKEMD